MSDLIPSFASWVAVGFLSTVFLRSSSSSSCLANSAISAGDTSTQTVSKSSEVPIRWEVGNLNSPTSAKVLRAVKQSRLVIRRVAVEVVLVIVSTLSAFLGVAHHIVVSLLEHLYYNTHPKPCQDFFSDLWDFFKVHARRRLLPSPLEQLYITTPLGKLQQSIMTKNGIFNIQNLCKITLDKICAAWYNGNFGRHSRERPTHFSTFERICQQVKMHKNKPAQLATTLVPLLILASRPDSQPTSTQQTQSDGRNAHIDGLSRHAVNVVRTSYPVPISNEGFKMAFEKKLSRGQTLC